MTCDEIIAKLKAEGDPRALAAWERMGLDFAGTYYGFNLTRLKALAKEVKKNHDLALELWDTGVHDARLLATMIEEPKKVTEKQVDTWMKDVKTVDLGDKLCENVVIKMPVWNKKIGQWTKSKKELLMRAGFYLIYLKANKGKDFSNEDFAPFLNQIESEINAAPNWAMETMNLALIGIGAKRPGMLNDALKVAKKIGRIEIDYGDTSCKNPDAVEVLSRKK